VPSPASAQFLSRRSAHYTQERLLKLQKHAELRLQNNKASETSFLSLSLAHLQLIKSAGFEAAFLLIFLTTQKSCSRFSLGKLNNHTRAGAS
jgi:hypothetical protein